MSLCLDFARSINASATPELVMSKIASAPFVSYDSRAMSSPTSTLVW